MPLKRKREPQFWESTMSEYEVTLLARYNSEISRGIMHDSAWKRQMAALQVRFDRAKRVHYSELEASNHTHKKLR